MGNMHSENEKNPAHRFRTVHDFKYCIFRNVCGIFISLISLVKQIREIKNVQNSLILLYYNVNFFKLANLNVANICKISKTQTILCANISEYTVF